VESGKPRAGAFISFSREAQSAGTSLILCLSFDSLERGACSRPLSPHPLAEQQFVTPDDVAASASDVLHERVISHD
jgi:hypothetical protein